MRFHRLIGCFTFALASIFASLPIAAETQRNTGPWDVPKILSTDTPFLFGKKDGLVQEVRYRSEPYRGKETWVFAYYGRPEGKGPFPAMLLVHGGGGKAFSEWAKLWAERGYVALAMDLAGNGPDGKPLEDGGPPQDDGTKFRKFTDADLRDMWTYQAVAAVLRGHAFLAAQKDDVDKDRIGITGISWGGYLTCIVAGIDDQLKVAVPVYGCGFLGDNSVWNEGGPLATMAAEDREQWLKFFDPSSYLVGVSCPSLFVNGTNDFAYPLDSYQKSYRLVTRPAPRLCVTVNMPHGHPQGWAPKEIGAFVDSVLKDGEPLATVGPLTVSADNVARASYDGRVPLSKAEFHFTVNSGRWQDRKWKTIAARIDAGRKEIITDVPLDRPLVGFMTTLDERGLVVSSDHVALQKN